jgi:hypothetical protein
VGKLQDWRRQSGGGFAPSGVGQVQRAAQGYANNDPRYANSQLGKWAAASGGGFVTQARSWYTGANQDDPRNGWTQTFAKKYFEQEKKLREEGKAAQFFDPQVNPEATGVVTWDHSSADGTVKFRFGDIYENGRKVGNVYDDYDNADGTADLMMAPWVLDPKTQSKIFDRDDPFDGIRGGGMAQRLRAEVAKVREQNTADFAKGQAAADFQAKVDARESRFTEGGPGGVGVDEAIVGGGAGGGAALGAGIGTLIAPGIGTLIGGGLGAVAGGLASYMNKDQLTEQAARAFETTSLATRENGLTAGIFEGINQWSQFGGKLIMPMSNLVQGAYDVAAGEIGDQTSEFYAVDKETGERKVPDWVKAADIAASAGDFLVQFASPVGASLFTAQMSGVIGGGVGSMVASGGETFDPRRGNFDNIFTDDDGNFDLGSAAAGIGYQAINVVQLGMARGLMSKADSSLAQLGQRGAYDRVRSDRLSDLLPSWAGGRSAAAKEALKAGGREVDMAGHKIVVDQAGNAVEGTKRAALSLLAPSEQLASLSAANIARREAAKRGGAVTADDFYKAAASLASGERKLTSAIVNGFGEGYEEGLQAALEPWSHNESPTGGEIFEAFLYGGASGFGMGLGAGARAATADQKLWNQARAINQMFNGEDLTYEDWKKMEPARKRALLATPQGLAKSMTDGIKEKVFDEQAYEVSAGVVGSNYALDQIRDEQTKMMGSLTDRTGGSFRIQQHEDAGFLRPDGTITATDAYSMPSDGVASSGRQLLKNFNDNLRGFAVQRAQVARDLEQAEARTAEVSTEEAAAAGTEVGNLQRQLGKIDLTLKWGQQIQESLMQNISRMYPADEQGAVDPQVLEAEVAQVNDGLRKMFRGEDFTADKSMTAEDRDAVARAVSMVFSRDPQDNPGSFQILVPQVSLKLTESNSDNILQVSHAILPAISGDYDGDRMRELNQLLLDDEQFAAIRSGINLLGAGASVNIGTPTYEQYNMRNLAKAIEGGSDTLKSYARQTLTQIGSAIKTRYTNVVPENVLNEVLKDFWTRVTDGDTEARKALIDGLALKAGGQISEFARANLSNEWLWMDQMIRSFMQRFQEAYAAHRPDVGEPTQFSGVAPNRMSSKVKERRAAAAAQMGQDLGIALEGSNLFRLFQDIHYNSDNSSVVSAATEDAPARLQRYVELYRAISSRVSDSALQRARTGNIITDRVFAQLEEMSREAAQGNPKLNRIQHMAILANMTVEDFDLDENGNATTLNGKGISVAQMLLKLSIAQDRKDKRDILDASPELQAKHARLEAMTRPGGRGNSNPVNAELAFIEVVKGQQLFNLIGDDAGIFGPHLTVEQWIRQHANRSTLDRRDAESVVRGDPAYIGKKQSKNMPYSYEDVSEGEQISAYRAVADAMIAVGRARVAIDTDTGKVVGEYAKRDAEVSKDLHYAYENVQRALRDFLGLQPRKDGELTPEVIQRLMESNPDFAELVMGLLPPKATRAIFDKRDGEIWMSNWVYGMFAADSAAEFEMIYWRNTLLAEWNMLRATLHEEGIDGQYARLFHRIDRRMHRIMFKLLMQPDGGLQYTRFLEKLTSADDLGEFMRWVNTTPGIKGNQAPLLAHFDDTSEFDIDKAEGGWGVSLEMSQRREAIAMLKQGSERLIDSLSEEKEALQADRRILHRIEQVIAAERGADSKLEKNDRALYDRMQQLIDQAAELVDMIGPEAMIQEIEGAVRGFYGKAHTKGVSATNVESVGNFAAIQDAIGFLHNYEKAHNALTAQSLDDLSSGMSQLAKDNIRTMDRHGRPIVWQKPTVEKMVELLKNPETRPAARAILFPQAWETNGYGGVSQQLLVGKSLEKLINGSYLKSMIEQTERLSNDKVLRAASLLNAQARKYGRENEFMRQVQDYLIAQTSSAEVANEPITRAKVVEAMRETLQLVQAAGSISPDITGEHPLEAILDAAKTEARGHLLTSTLGMKSKEKDYAGLVLENFIQSREAELAEEIADLYALAERDPIVDATLAEQEQALRDEFESWKQRVEALVDNDYIGNVIEMFRIPADETAKAAKKSALLDYFAAHRGMVQRHAYAMSLWDRITLDLQDPDLDGQVTLTDEEWIQLSDIVTADYLNRASVSASNNVTVYPFPSGDRRNDVRYYDRSFSYLLDGVLDPESPLVKAQRELHQLAGLVEEQKTAQDIAKLLQRTYLKDDNFGEWTDEIVKSSTQANERLDSSASGAGIAQAGSRGKIGEQGVLSAAQRRTTLKPPAELQSSTTLNHHQLSFDPFAAISITLPNGNVVARPLAQLNGRFASSVKVTLPDGTELELLGTDVGRRWLRDKAVADSGYQEIHVERINLALKRIEAEQNVRPEDLSVTITFFHPDSQPTAPEWHNNVYFEGTNFRLDADEYESLNAGLWFAPNGLVQTGSRDALDAAKKGKPAITPITVPTSAEREELEGEIWKTDLGRVLRTKAKKIFEIKATGKLGPDEVYNAIYKNLKMQHFVRGTVDGEPVLWTAEQVIEHQVNNPGVELPLGDAELWIPSADVLRRMVAGDFDMDGEYDLSKVRTYRGVDTAMLERVLPGVRGESTTLEQTSVKNRAYQQQLTLRPILDETTQRAYETRLKYLDNLRAEIQEARTAFAGNGNFNTHKNLERIIDIAQRAVRSEGIRLDWLAAGIPWIGPRSMKDLSASELVLHQKAAAMSADNQARAGWIYQETGEGRLYDGTITHSQLNPKETALRVAPGDLVVVDVDSFGTGPKASKTAQKRAEYFADRGAIIAFVGTGGSDLRTELGSYLESKLYELVPGSKHLYKPAELGTRYQNVKARHSTWLETTGVSRRNMLMIALTQDLPVMEGAAYALPNDERLGEIGVQLNLVRTNAFGTLNVPTETTGSNPSQIEAVRRHLRGMDNEQDIQWLAEMSVETIDDQAERDRQVEEFKIYWRRMMQRFDETEGTVLPAIGSEFGTGDFIPLIDNRGRILLYRHGYQAPANRESVLEMWGRPRPESYRAHNIAVYPSKKEQRSTDHTGTVSDWIVDPEYGLRVELHIDHQQFGDKYQIEWNGVKYSLTPRPDSIQLPEHGVFADWGINLISDLDYVESKEGIEGLVNNHRTAFMAFGIDFLPDIMRFLGTDRESVALEFLDAVANYTDEPPLSVEAALEILYTNERTLLTEHLQTLPPTVASALGVQADWIAKLDQDTFEAHVARAMFTYLRISGAEVEHVLRSGGLNDDQADIDDQARLMPAIFTQYFDEAPEKVRAELNKRFNAQLYNVGPKGTGYRLGMDWQMQSRTGDPNKNLSFYLQFAKAHSSGDNPLKDGMSFDETSRVAVSAHSAAIATQALYGARSAAARDLDAEKSKRADANIYRFKDREDGGVWRMLTAGAPDSAFLPWRMDTPAEAEYKGAANERRVHFRQAIVKNEENGWTPKQIQDYKKLSGEIMRALGMKAKQRELVDYWVRQFVGREKALDNEGKPLPEVTGKQALEFGDLIRQNVQNRYMPTAGARVPLLDAADLQAIYRSNQRSKKWQPRTKVDVDTEYAEGWDDWVAVSLGSTQAEVKFDPFYTLALDGFWHTYQNATDDLMDLPVSLDVIKTEGLLLPENVRLVEAHQQLKDAGKLGKDSPLPVPGFITSLDPNVQQILTDPAYLDSANASIDDLIGGRRVAGRLRGEPPPASEDSKRIAQIKKYRTENGIPFPANATLRDLRRNGAQFIDYSTNTNALVRTLIHLRVGTATLNPALWVSAGPEMWIRGTLDRMANNLTLQGTQGFTANRIAAMSEWLSDTPAGELLDRLGLTARYTPEQIQRLGVLYDTLGARNDFKSMIYKSLNFRRPHGQSVSRFERIMEKYAAFGMKLQDPTYGMSAKGLAMRYVDAALQHIQARPTVNPISVETLAAELSTDPEFLRKNYPEAHDYATNAVAQIRSLKQTPWNMAIRGFIEPMATSSNPAVNLVGNIVFKIPLIFSNYATNAATTITGSQGFSDAFAMFLDGRKKWGWVAKAQATMRGEQYDPEADRTLDLGEVIEGIDLSRSFIRGGLTHTGLFAFGLMAGGLGLTGEDEEERRRRRALEYQNAPQVHDPRKLAEDFRNADAIWLFGKPYQMPWIAKQFISPIMGMERFFDTGDFRHVTWGFQDALGSFPLINTMMWADAVETAQDFVNQAEKAAAKGTDQGAIEGMGFLLSAVGTYERMLFENSFVNGIYQAWDEYDRDPFAQPLLDSDEDIQVDHAGQPRETEALTPYVDEKGNILEGYMARSGASARLHQFTENRFSMALVTSLFTGFQGDYFRRQMVPKTVSIEAPVLTETEAKAAIRSIMQATNGGFVSLTPEEALNALRNAGVGGKYARNAELEPLAEKMAKDSGFAPLSVLDDKGREVLTKDGARAVMQGLFKGTVAMGDPNLRGIHITPEMRDEIAKDWTKDLVQEGINLGLDKTKAVARMKRIMYGPLEDRSVPGLAEILYSKEISYSQKLQYNQLNTTFVRGPDGLPWATGFKRSFLPGILGTGMIEPDKGFDGEYKGIMSLDQRMNSVDLAAGQNLGLRALKPVNTSPRTDEEIGKAIEEAIKEAEGADYEPLKPFSSGGGGGGGRRFGGGGGGGGGYTPQVYFTRMNPFPEQRAVFYDSIPFINTSNPIIRRADIRRERVWSERGRLKQWQ